MKKEKKADQKKRTEKALKRTWKNNHTKNKSEPTIVFPTPSKGTLFSLFLPRVAFFAEGEFACTLALTYGRLRKILDYS